jgi:hypothetical protein
MTAAGAAVVQTAQTALLPPRMIDPQADLLYFQSHQ